MSQPETSAKGVAEGTSNLQTVHAQMLADKSVQHKHIDLIEKIDPPPKWLANLIDAIFEILRALSPLITVLFWVGLAALALLLLYFVLSEILDIEIFPRKKAAAPASDEPQWQPSEQVARDLLAAADRLAADGRFNEAVHLILLRSIEDIERFRPRTIRPALTARDIGAMPALPEAAKPIFARISAAVEKALFAGLTIEPAEFSACREAYARFALPEEWRR